MPRSVNRQIDQWIAKVEKSVGDFSRKDRRRIVRKAARPVVKQMRAIAPRSKRPHYRYPKGQPRVKYNPGNLRRSIKVLPFRKTADAFVGPQFARKRAPEYGAPGQPVDAYYAAMIYGSARRFRQRVIEPAARSSESQVIARLKKESRAAIKKAAAQRGIKTN